MSVSTFILMTPLVTASLISSFDEPEPPWKTRKLSCVSDISIAVGLLKHVIPNGVGWEPFNMWQHFDTSLLTAAPRGIPGWVDSAAHRKRQALKVMRLSALTGSPRHSWEGGRGTVYMGSGKGAGETRSMDFRWVDETVIWDEAGEQVAVR